ncbi:major facilitator superfamily domain-containing protein [Bisporella sp. PMI_857]|nr:major facilitator superfamily domain-containing protein [Bisporella sp. PMI_857]
MGRTRPLLSARKSSALLHYQTFPTQPPKRRGHPLSRGSSSGQDGASPDDNEILQCSPLPFRQLIVLAVIALAEQTAFNSISPYLPEMTLTFPEVKEGQLGLYVGTIASSFALAQFATNLFWGWLSDRIGRKPVIMLGTLLTSACFVAFGFCRTLWQAILVQVLMGLVNGNQGIVSTCLGEITDKSNQSQAFTYLPVIYGLGGIVGPALGGLLVFKDVPFKRGKPNPYPYLLPNLVGATVLIMDLVVTAFFLEESLEEAKDLPPLKKRIKNLFTWLWQFTSGALRPTYIRDSVGSNSGEDSESRRPVDAPELLGADHQLTRKEVLNRDTILLLATYLIFQLSNISFNTLYPIYGAAPRPTGRELNPEEIGLSLSFAGIVMIVFQVVVFGKLKEKMGNRKTYCVSLFLFFLAMMMMPWIGHRESSPPFEIGNGTVWLWVELGFVLLVKTIAAVGGLTSALLLITNSAPNHSILGTLNGLAQTLSAAGRAAGPFISGGLFSIATRVRPKGEALAWGVFGGIAFLGYIGSLGIRGENLESDGWNEESDTNDEEDA